MYRPLIDTRSSLRSICARHQSRFPTRNGGLWGQHGVQLGGHEQQFLGRQL